MIKRKKIKTDNGTGEYSMFYSPDFEYVDPIDYYASSYIAVNVAMKRDIVLFKKPPFPIDVIEKVILKQVLNDWNEKLREIQKTQIPINILTLLNSRSKKEQLKLLKNSSINPDQLIAFIFKAKTDFGYLFSQYTVEHQHKGLEISQMPKVVVVKNGAVQKIGDTPLTDGQLKHAIEYRKVIVTKILDRGDEWHCLFLTFDSLKGKEKWKGGQPHYHYISDKFGIPREKVVDQLKREEYKLGTLPHIDLVGYREGE